MRVVLHVTTGSQAGQKVLLHHGQSIKIGRAEKTDLAFPHDAQMSQEHFAITFSTDGCRLRDLNSTNGTIINGQRVSGEAVLNYGDQIVAGETVFTLSREGTPSVAVSELDPGDEEANVPMEVFKERVVEYFRQLPEPLFAILDAARDPLVLALLIQSDDLYQSLYEGPKGDTLAAAAPYLVQLPSDSPLLETLIEMGWGESWGVYLTCEGPFKDVRKHFRRFLMVEIDEGKKVYFRFYDPRVLRVFLPTCLPDEARQFFGPMDSFYMEDVKPKNVLRFTTGQQGAKELVRLQDQATGLGI
jgi:hypothetical protein